MSSIKLKLEAISLNNFYMDPSSMAFKNYCCNETL